MRSTSIEMRLRTHCRMLHEVGARRCVGVLPTRLCMQRVTMVSWSRSFLNSANFPPRRRPYRPPTASDFAGPQRSLVYLSPAQSFGSGFSYTCGHYTFQVIPHPHHFLDVVHIIYSILPLWIASFVLFDRIHITTSVILCPMIIQTN